MNNIEELQIILNNKLVDPQGVSFLTYLESTTEKNKRAVERRISAIITKQKEHWGRLIEILEIKATNLKLQFRIVLEKLNKLTEIANEK